MQITCLRFLIGGILLIPFALRSMKKKGAAFTRADAGFFALTGFLCVAFSMVLYQMAVTYTKASVVAIIFSCNPIFVTVLAADVHGGLDNNGADAVGDDVLEDAYLYETQSAEET